MYQMEINLATSQNQRQILTNPHHLTQGPANYNFRDAAPSPLSCFSPPEPGSVRGIGSAFGC
jgi:hypothetical protein